MPYVVYHIDANLNQQVDYASLNLVAIYLPGNTISNLDEGEMRDACEFIQTNSHCKEEGLDRRGVAKRGPLCMTSVGFNFAPCNHGKVSVYKRRSCPEPLQIQLWGEALRYLGVVRNILSRQMGPYPLQALSDRCLIRAGESPSMLDMCTSIHQTLDAEVWPHLDGNDFDYTVITWAQVGGVFGPFLLHSLGLAFDVQVSICG
jgi:hypothetical protein